MRNSQERHEMKLEKTHASGAEEWFCPTCCRRFLMRWPPDYKRIIIEAGDEYATHTAGKGGLRLGSLQIRPEEQAAFSEGNFELWAEMLKGIDLEGL